MEPPDGINADGGHIESEILLRFADFHHDKCGPSKPAASLDGSIRSFHGLNCTAPSPLIHARLSDTQTADFLGNSKTKSDMLPFRCFRRPFCQNSFSSNVLRQTQG